MPSFSILNVAISQSRLQCADQNATLPTPISCLLAGPLVHVLLCQADLPVDLSERSSSYYLSVELACVSDFYSEWTSHAHKYTQKRRIFCEIRHY
ncbi:hypothetical protein B0H34DRAFT_201571 [Crassisporium funariophilum]|nr:hypothetical protein B0H34DRAFT_201571 [Crassisporium funariophilum]